MSRTLSIIRLFRRKYAGMRPNQMSRVPMQPLAGVKMNRIPGMPPTAAVAQPTGTLAAPGMQNPAAALGASHRMGTGIPATGLDIPNAQAPALSQTPGAMSTNPIQKHGPLGAVKSDGTTIVDGNHGAGIRKSTGSLPSKLS